MSAKIVVAMLIVATVFGLVGAAIGLASGDNGATERDLRDRVATLTQARDAALVDIQELDVELATVREQLQAAETANDDLIGRADELEAQIATLTEQRTQAQASVADLAAQVSALESQVAGLDVDVKSANDRAVAAIAARDAIVKRFPMAFDVSLVDGDVVGAYDIVLSQIHCAGLASCGTTPTLADPTIRSTSGGVLRLGIAGFAEGGLSRTGGALHFIANSTTAVPPCSGEIRSAEVVMTLFPGSYRIADDGARTVVDVGAVVTVEAPAVGTCPAVLAFYSAELTPHA